MDSRLQQFWNKLSPPWIIRPASVIHETAATVPQPTADYSVSRALIVTLRFQGISIPIRDGVSLELRLPHLLLLERLARQVDPSVERAIEQVGEQTSLPRKRMEEFVAQLRDYGLLLDSPAPMISDPSVRPDRTSAASDVVAFDSDIRLAAASPLPLRLTAAGFECIDHDGGNIMTLSGRELAAIEAFTKTKTAGEVFKAQTKQLGKLAYTKEAFDELLLRLVRNELLAPVSKAGHLGRENTAVRSLVAGQMRFRGVTNRLFNDEIEGGVCRGKIRIASFDTQSEPIPLATGMVYAYAQAYKDGLLNQYFHFSPQAAFDQQREQLLEDGIAVTLFSNYLWSHNENLKVSRRVKELSPNSVTIHGGPDTPKYANDVDTYFRVNEHVDIAIHGEGEITFAEVLEAIKGNLTDANGLDASALYDVPGITFRDGEQIVRTGDRSRISDLDDIPSPFLNGLFDYYGEAKASVAIIETNRGCPFGCTFCDWGSATASKIRRFSLDRVYAEMEWCARNSIPRIIFADANFGMLERDVDIARKAVELKQQYGYPQLIGTNYAKNNTKYLQQIVKIFIDSGILAEGLLSLQSMDANTLDVIDRSNIKLEKYDEIAREFRAAKLPLFIDLMLGLPGSTLESFRNDLQGAIDREVTAKVFQTELLVNSPMNEPGYRNKHAIETAVPLHSVIEDDDERKNERAYVIASSSFTREHYNQMLALRSVFTLCENYGVLRQVSRYVRQEAGIEEVDFYDRVSAESSSQRERWPAISGAFKLAPVLGVPPVSWHYFIEEIRDFVVTHFGIANDSALDTVLQVQHALLPARSRNLPLNLQLAHDYSAWHSAILAAKDGGQRDWPSHVPRLGEFDAAAFVVEDPREVCTRGIGYRIEAAFHGDWELESPVSRAMPGEHSVA